MIRPTRVEFVERYRRTLIGLRGLPNLAACDAVQPFERGLRRSVDQVNEDAAMVCKIHDLERLAEATAGLRAARSSLAGVVAEHVQRVAKLDARIREAEHDLEALPGLRAEWARLVEGGQ